MPWMNQMGITALATMLVIILISRLDNGDQPDHKAIPLSGEIFKTDRVFNISAYIVLIITAVLYAIFW